MISTLTQVTPETLGEIAKEMGIRRTQEVFLLFALGSQFDHLIKQKLDELGVFCLVADPARVTANDVRLLKPIGIILSGGPASVHTDPPPFDAAIFDLGIPVFGICLGFQLWAQHLGVQVQPADKREFGVHLLTIADHSSPLIGGITYSTGFQVLESHGDRILPHPDLEILGSTEHAPVAAGHHQHLWGVQFHPEVSDTEHGLELFENFCFTICGAKDTFPAGDVSQEKIAHLAQTLAGKIILLALSGGTDSSTVAYLLKAARIRATLPIQIVGVYIKGIDRPDDEAHVREFFGQQPWLQLTVVDATEQFLEALKGVTTMEKKREAMRNVYKAVLEAEAERWRANVIAQGTLYTDISESGEGYDSGATKARIKQHHNVGLQFSVPEVTPLADQVKDTGRNIGRAVGVPEALLLRHPFPGPGLILRIEGDITKDKLGIARVLDDIFMEEIRKAGLYESIWQAGVFLTHSVTKCTKGDGADFGLVAECWAFWSVNGFTAQAAEIPWEVMKTISRRMTNEIREIGAVCFNTSDKPPRTIERG
ncbi:MAG: GMP synthase (glutamine-hydrolyzing) [Patescibacteria group bacterium]|jgi:GMP synthase (glutamine-hydrolysing)